MKLYSTLRSFLSEKNKGALTKILIESGLKPRINKRARSPFDKGIIVFSADFEMAWAFRFSRTRRHEAVEKGLAERKNVPILLDLFDKYNIPVTWATVGHLFLNECRRGPGGLPHPEMPRPDYFKNRNWNFSSGDWYQHDPCTDYNTDPAWYASDLVDLIIRSDVKHEMGCHTFSHLDFTYKNCPRPLADAELDACIKAASVRGVRLQSMVFPGGTAGNYESLAERGFTCYRQPMKNHIDLPYIDSHGLVVLPSSLGLDKDPYGWDREFHLQMIRKYLDKTAKHKQVCHFWFHPSMDGWYLENVMPEVLKMVADYAGSSKIEVKTMCQLAELVISNR
ncbi:MAG TPA: polysaccharide deacetylase family protein [Bacteroidales bacterium]|nr:polysaccharide deacetylase family protein [Bacteroidales bacterium]HNR40731.1 polysaccharide deacetylase family protein [Bacteroidales bacterium]